MKKKVLALVLALTMALSLLPVTAMADGGGASTPYYTVTFNPNGATSGTVPTQADTAAGDTFTLPSAGKQDELRMSGYGFVGWFDGTDTYPAGYNYTMPDKDVEFFAQWISIGIDSFDVLDDKESGEKIINVRYTVTPITTTDHTLDIWWRIAGDGNSLIVTAKGDTVTVPANRTLSRELTSTFVSDDLYLGRLLSDATQLRLHVRDEGSNENSADRAFCVKSSFQSDFHTGRYVTLYNNDGLYNDSTENPVIFVDEKDTYGAFEWVDTSLYSRTGYTFLGFADDPNDPAADYTSDALKALKWETSAKIKEWYAVWKRNEYTVTVDANAGGTVNVQNKALYGEDVAYTITANDEFALVSAKMVCSGEETVLQANGNFAMPAADVKLVVEFVRLTTPVGPVQNNTYYFVEHYVEQPDGSYKLETEVLSGKIGDNVTADSTKYDDNAHHVNTAKSTLNGVVSFDLTAHNPMETVLTLKVYYDITPYYPPVDPTPVIPSVDVDIHDDTLSDAAKAVGSAVKSGNADITPVAGYTKESIAQMQKDDALKLVVEKKNSYDPAEKALIDTAAQEKGETALVQFLEIDVTLRTMNDVIVAEVDDTIVDLTITVDLNAEMQKAAKEGKTIYVARAHDGKVTFIEGTLNAEKTQFTFDSSKFSTYALVAFDSQTVVAAKTADAGIFLAVSMSILSVTGSAVLLKKKED